MAPLLIGTLLALGALAFVLAPLFGSHRLRRAGAEGDPEADAAESYGALSALREVEFDRETGKLSDADYAALRATYEAEALAAMRAESAAPDQGAAGADVADEAEAVIIAYRSRQRSCEHCGPRPEPDAIYCSNCGRYLSGRCASCGAVVTETAARFCTTCGTTLAA